MLFFDDFIKKIENTKVNAKEVEKFRLDGKKTTLLLGTGIPLELIGLFEIYSGYTAGMKWIYFVLGAICIYLGFKQMKLIFSYGITLNFKEDRIKGQGVDLSFDDIEKCTLKESIVGRGNRLQVVVEIDTFDRRRIIIPLMMGRKVYFVALLKDKLGKKFNILKK